LGVDASLQFSFYGPWPQIAHGSSITITSYRHSSQEGLESKTRISTSISTNNVPSPTIISSTEIHHETAETWAANPVPHGDNVMQAARPPFAGTGHAVPTTLFSQIH